MTVAERRGASGQIASTATGAVIRPTLCARSCQPRTSSWRSSVQWQLCQRADGAQHGRCRQPSRWPQPCRAAPPWVATTTVPPGAASAASCSAAPTRLPRSSRVSDAAPGSGSPARQRAYSSGKRSATSVEVQALPLAEVPLAQPRRRCVPAARSARRARRRCRAARLRSLATMASGRSAASSGAAARGLVAAELVERYVGLPLDAAGGVPVGVAVPPDDQPGHSAAADPLASASTRSRSTNGMVGQSFQSRSSA